MCTLCYSIISYDFITYFLFVSFPLIDEPLGHGKANKEIAWRNWKLGENCSGDKGGTWPPIASYNLARRAIKIKDPMSCHKSKCSKRKIEFDWKDPGSETKYWWRSKMDKIQMEAIWELAHYHSTQRLYIFAFSNEEDQNDILSSDWFFNNRGLFLE